MKKLITKYWGIGLILVLLSSLFLVAAPAGAADPLNWEAKTDAPSTLFGVLAPDSDVIDYDVAPGGMTMYAITRTYGATAQVSIAITDTGGDETFTFTYINENGIAGRQGVATVPTAGIIGTAVALALQGNDAGIFDVTNVAAGLGATNNATAGAFQIIGADGATVLATFTVATGACADGALNPGLNQLMQSTFAGIIWSNITARLPGLGIANDFANGFDYVMMAPDDPNVIVVAAATPNAGLAAAISVNGGATFTSMGVIQSGTLVACTGIRGIDISPLVTGGTRYIAAYGTGGATIPGIYYYNYGAGVGSWKNACLAAASDFVAGPDLSAGVGTYDNVVAFNYSPNFPSDYMGVAVLQEDNAAIGDIIDYHILSFNSRTWDTGIAAGYPAALYTTAAGAGVVNAADIALLPEYDGGDESLRIGFVSLALTDNLVEVGGAWRYFDSAGAKVFGTTAAVASNSIAFDGTNVAVGQYDTNNVWRSADPLSTNPTFLPARNLKKIGIDSGTNDMVNIKFVGDALYGSKRGTASAMSKSVDYGNTFNDFTLMDSGSNATFNAGNHDDIYFAGGSDPWYLAAHDDMTSCVYRMTMGTVTRVLCVAFAAGPDFMLRGIDSDANIVYAADEGGQVIYYTADGGLERWFQRNNVPEIMQDLAVESAQVIYVGNGINIYKSVNAGFVWSAPVNSQLSGGNAVNTLLSLGENELVVGGTLGGVTYSTDGGTSFTATFGVFNSFTPVQIAATGLGAGDYIFAAEEGTNDVWRHSIGTLDFFKQMNFPDATVNAETNTGMLLQDGLLYVLQTGGGQSYLTRSMSPAVDGTHTAAMWGTRYNEAGTFANTPSALRASSGSIILYGIEAAAGVMYFDDALAQSGPALIAPADAYRVDIVSALMGNVQAIDFTWSRISLATSYELQISLDSEFTSQLPLDALGTGDNDPALELDSAAGTVSQIVGGGNFQPGATYYWRVRAYLPTTSVWSEVRTFTVQPTGAAVPEVGSPENGGTVATTTPAFSWTPVSQATMYQFQLSDDPSFATTLVDETLSGTGIAPNVTLTDGMTYFWRVKAIAPVEGDWSAISNLTVALPAAPTPPVEIIQQPAPEITVETPAPAPDIIIPEPAPTEEIAPAYIWAIIIIGAILVIAVIVLIVRTRRQV